VRECFTSLFLAIFWFYVVIGVIFGRWNVWGRRLLFVCNWSWVKDSILEAVCRWKVWQSKDEWDLYIYMYKAPKAQCVFAINFDKCFTQKWSGWTKTCCNNLHLLIRTSESWSTDFFYVFILCTFPWYMWNSNWVLFFSKDLILKNDVLYILICN